MQNVRCRKSSVRSVTYNSCRPKVIDLHEEEDDMGYFMTRVTYRELQALVLF